MKARIKEFDLEGSIQDWTFLPDELIEAWLPNFTGAVPGGVNTAAFAGSGAIQSYDKAYRLAVRPGSQHQVQVATVEPTTPASVATATSRKTIRFTQHLL